MQTDLSTKQYDYLSKIQSSAHSLLGIINDVLDFSKIEAGKLEMESIEFNLENVLENLSNVVSLKAEEQGLEFLFSVAEDVPLMLIGDPLRLGEILMNLASNAVKFTDSGEIVVRIELESGFSHDQICLLFSVRDTGVGIPPEKLSGLFNPFTQIDGSTTRRFGGTGLGLTISKRLVEMMNGRIWAESIPGEGSTFYFTAEFRCQAQTEDARLLPAPDLRGMRVLVVDDNETAREILEATLSSFSFDVVVARSGQEALLKLNDADENLSYDLVLLDWKMPEMDGIETAKYIKQDVRLPWVPMIIMVSAYGREELIRQAKQAGVDAFLVKPITPSLLFDAIMEVFGREITRMPRLSTSLAKDSDTWQQHLKGSRVLLVEDNSLNQQVARELLENVGILVDVVNNGKEAAQCVMSDECRVMIDYDAILMDIQMPEMDGYEATRKIRVWENSLYQAPGTKHQAPIPIIAMTAHALIGEREKCLKAGMNDYISKPIDPEQLFLVLSRWIRGNHQPPIFSHQSQVSGLQLIETSESDMLNTDNRLLNTEKLPGLDVASGLQRVAGNQKLYLKLLREFAEDYAGVVTIIREALVGGDMNRIKHVAHTLKGMAGNMGATILYHAVRELEFATIQNLFERFDVLIPQFEQALHDVLESIHILTAIQASPAIIPPEHSHIDDTSEMKLLLNELTHLLKEGDAESLDRLHAVKGSLDHAGLERQAALLEEYILNYDFEDARKILDDIIKMLRRDNERRT